MERFGGCWGRVFGVLYIDLGDQRSVVGMFLGCLGVLWRSLEEPWGPLGVSWEVHGHPWRPGNVLGASWGALGVILEVWGDPWVTTGKSKC